MKMLIGIIIALSMTLTLCACSDSPGLGLELDETTTANLLSTTGADDNTSSTGSTTGIGDLTNGTTTFGTTDSDDSTTTSNAPVSTLPSGTATEVTTDKSGKPVNSLLDSAVGDILKGNEYSMKFTMQAELEGETQTMPVSIYVSGDKKYVETKMYELMKISFLSDGTDFYLIIPLMSGYIKMPADQSGEYNDMFNLGDMGIADTSDMNYIGTTKVSYKGTEYICETYEIDGITTKYYFSDGKLKRIENIDTDGTSSTMENIEISSKVDDSVFNIPKNYREISEDDLGALSGILG